MAHEAPRGEASASPIADAATLARQYRTSANLAARAKLHARYGRGDWFPWLAAQFEWPEGGNVADVGCGAGWFWAEAARVLPKSLTVELVDQSPGMVAEAQERLDGLGRTARGHAADAMALPFADASLDVVMAAHMLYHVADPVRALVEFRRVLKADGMLLVALNGPRHLRQIWSLGRSPGEAMPAEPSAEAFGIPRAAGELVQLFAAVDFRRYDDTLRCTSADDVVAYRASSTFDGTQPTATDLAVIRAAVEAEMAAHDGAFRIEKDVGAFICRKGR